MLIYLQLIDTPEDRSRFEQLYIAYRDLMFYIARKTLDNDQDAEDAVHDAFVAVAKKISKISTLQSPKTKAYVVTVVERKAIDIYRAKRRNPTGPLTEDMEGIPVDYHGNDGLA